MCFYLFLAVSYLYYCHRCGTVHLHPDTILRKHGVHQRLKWLVVVKARTPRLKHLCLHSSHLVGDFIISVSLNLSLVHLLPSGKAPNNLHQCGSFQSSWPYLFTTLFCPLAVHLTSQNVQDPTDSFQQLWSLYMLLPSDSCIFSCPSGSYFHSTSTKKLAVLTQSWLSLLSVLCAILYICLSIYDSVWKLSVHLFLQFMALSSQGDWVTFIL